MFTKLAVLVTIMPFLAAALPDEPVTVTQTKTTTVTTTQTVTAAPSSATCNQCNTGPIQCCNSVQPASSTAASTLLSQVGVTVQDLTTPIGINCSPITAIGVGGTQCNQQPVCCENNSFNGLIAIGCVSIIVNA